MSRFLQMIRMPIKGLFLMALIVRSSLSAFAGHLVIDGDVFAHFLRKSGGLRIGDTWEQMVEGDEQESLEWKFGLIPFSKHDVLPKELKSLFSHFKMSLFSALIRMEGNTRNDISYLDHETQFLGSNLLPQKISYPKYVRPVELATKPKYISDLLKQYFHPPFSLKQYVFLEYLIKH